MLPTLTKQRHVDGGLSSLRAQPAWLVYLECSPKFWIATPERRCHSRPASCTVEGLEVAG